MKKLISIATTLISLIILAFLINISDISFVIPESKSVDGSLFLLQDKETKNDYVVFEYNNKPYKNYIKGKLFIKKVGCGSGSNISIIKNRIYCDKKLIATALQKNNQGVILDRLEFNGVIPENKVFLIGDHSLSYDSRYFGLVDKIHIRNSARRIF